MSQLALPESWLNEAYWPILLAAVGALFLLSWLLAGWQTLRRCRAMLAALNDSTRSRIVVERGPTFGGFAASFQPAPEPFLHCNITYQALSNLDLVGWMWRLVAGRRDRFVIRARVNERPQSELVWTRGRTPGRAIGRSPSTSLWVLHRLDFTNSEYATRGTNPAALMHSFVDLQTRFEPLLQQVHLQAEKIPEVEIVLRGNGLNPDEIPALITTIRAAGRAMLLH
jgi:hypothetical protein